MSDFPLKERCGKTLDRRTISQLKARIEQLEATIKEWESGALVRGWREIRADAQPPKDET